MKKLIFALLLMFAVSITTSKAQVADFTLTTTKGGTINLYTWLMGNNAVICDFFFLNCGNCQSFASKLDQIYKDYYSNMFYVKMVSFEIQEDSDADIDQWKIDHGATYPACGGIEARNYWSSSWFGILGSGFGQVALIIPNPSDPANSTIAFTASGGVGDNDVQEIRNILWQNGFWMLGTKELTPEEAGVSTYPNPAADYFTIGFDETMHGDVGIEVFNLKGERVIAQFISVDGVNTIDINTTGLSDGLYMVRIDSENGTVTSKLQVVR